MVYALPKFNTRIRYMTLNELQLFACNWALQCSAPTTLALYGNMGSGKTTFAQFAIKALMNDDMCDVVSPTFPIIQTYNTPKGEIWHADLYRLKNLHEVEETGLIEAMYQHICIIEWPQLVEPILNSLPHQKLVIAR